MNNTQSVQQHHVDGLAVMPEDDLNRTLRRSQEQLGRMRREGATEGIRRYAEVEVCFLQREVEIRTRRRRAHDTWLAQRPVFA
jgi:hypothetical protein